MFTAANVLTVFRMALTAPFVYLIYSGRFGLALLVYFTASVTDFADGYLARNYNQHSRLGRFLDPLADKLLTTAGYVVLALPHEGIPSIPVWLAIAVIGRDVLILLGSLVVYLSIGFTEFKPTLSGKVNTFLEMGLIVVFLALQAVEAFTFMLPSLYIVVLVSVIVSFVDYIAQGVRIVHRTARP